MSLTYIFYVDGDVVTGEVKELPGCTVKESSLERCVAALILAQKTWVDGWLNGARDRRYSASNLRLIEFKTRTEAEAVLNALKDVLSSFNFVTLADFYSLCNVPMNYTDHNWGWGSLDSARIVRTTNNLYRIVFPQIIVVGRSE